MKNNGADQNRYTILECLSTIPRRMLSLHSESNLSEFVLHNLCQGKCFNIERAAYLLDNPDFDCLKGVAGFCKSESYVCEKPFWECPHDFSIHMQASPFNQKVRSTVCNSSTLAKASEEEIVSELAHKLGFKSYSYCAWDTKHHNHGILIYEKPSVEISVEDLVNGASLLGLCPVF